MIQVVRPPCAYVFHIEYVRTGRPDTAKLTLSINERAIESGKQYASAQGRTLSPIVESYLETLKYQKPRKSPPSIVTASKHRACGGVGRDRDPARTVIWFKDPACSFVAANRRKGTRRRHHHQQCQGLRSVAGGGRHSCGISGPHESTARIINDCMTVLSPPVGSADSLSPTPLHQRGHARSKTPSRPDNASCIRMPRSPIILGIMRMQPVVACGCGRF